ncbi:hypothetical protein LINPERHAP2_LOCUS23710 [Linum perenne]
MSRSSSSSISRKLHPAKRALKRFVTRLQSKLDELDFPGAIRVIRDRTNQIISHVFPGNNSSLVPKTKMTSCQRHSHYNYISDYYSSNRNKKVVLHKSKNRNKNVSAIYIDQLYSEETASILHNYSNLNSNTALIVVPTEDEMKKAERGKEMVIGYKRPPLPMNNSNYNDRGGAVDQTTSSLVQRRKKKEPPVVIVEENNYETVETLEDAWREVVARSPQLKPVEVRTEEFIYKFQKVQKDLNTSDCYHQIPK